MTQIEDIIAKAWDAEDAAQMGEPSPWVIDAADLDPDWVDGRRACARAAIAELDAAGFVVVPKEPTDAMTRAAAQRPAEDFPPGPNGPARMVTSDYRVMIEARPK